MPARSVPSLAAATLADRPRLHGHDEHPADEHPADERATAVPRAAPSASVASVPVDECVLLPASAALLCDC